MINTLPLALIAIGASNTILASGIFCQISEVMLTDLSEGRTISPIIKITGDENLGFGTQVLDGIYRLTKTICYHFPERTTITLTAIPAGRMNNKYMQRIARKDFTTDIEDVTSRPHALYWSDTNGIAIDRSERERRIEQGHIDATKVR